MRPVPNRHLPCTFPYVRVAAPIINANTRSPKTVQSSNPPGQEWQKPELSTRLDLLLRPLDLRLGIALSARIAHLSVTGLTAA
jgi:hypothetical protein